MAGDQGEVGVIWATLLAYADRPANAMAINPCQRRVVGDVTGPLSRGSDDTGMSDLGAACAPCSVVGFGQGGFIRGAFGRWKMEDRIFSLQGLKAYFVLFY